jgi:hypothetical protein
LIGFFILPPIDEPPIDEPLPEDEAPDGLLVEPGEVDPEVPVAGLPGAVIEPPAAPGAVPPVLTPTPIAPLLPQHQRRLLLLGRRPMEPRQSVQG